MEGTGRVAREKETVGLMVGMYCRGVHGTRGSLCPECSELLDYSRRRLDLCRFGEDKPKCSKCPVHCYSDAMRGRIREVMRYSGPRMALHPLAALRHILP